METRAIYSNKGHLCLLFCVVIMFSVNMMADTKQCPKCHGSGWQVTIPDVGHYGVERHKQKCPVCGDMVFSGHRDKCTMCGGSGGVDDGRRSSRGDDADRRAAEGEVFFVRHLTPGENQMRLALIQSLFDTKFVVDTCSVCHGSTLCKQCGGVQNLSIDADVTTLCRVCGGSGRCISCGGRGIINERTEQAHSPAEKEIIAGKIKVLIELANLRCSKNISPSDPKGPSLGIDGDGNFYLKDGVSSAEGGEYDGDGSSADKSYSGFSCTSSSKKGSNTITIIAVIVVVVVALFFIRKRKKK